MRVVIRSQTRSLATRSGCRVLPVSRKSVSLIRPVSTTAEEGRISGRRHGHFGAGKALRNANFGYAFL